jgi:hypothetical protein
VPAKRPFAEVAPCFVAALLAHALAWQRRRQAAAAATTEAAAAAAAAAAAVGLRLHAVLSAAANRVRSKRIIANVRARCAAGGIVCAADGH